MEFYDGENHLKSGSYLTLERPKCSSLSSVFDFDYYCLDASEEFLALLYLFELDLKDFTFAFGTTW